MGGEKVLIECDNTEHLHVTVLMTLRLQSLATPFYFCFGFFWLLKTWNDVTTKQLCLPSTSNTDSEARQRSVHENILTATAKMSTVCVSSVRACSQSSSFRA